MAVLQEHDRLSAEMLDMLLYYTDDASTLDDLRDVVRRLIVLLRAEFFSKEAQS